MRTLRRRLHPAVWLAAVLLSGGLATTLPQQAAYAATQTANAVVDAYVNADAPDTNYGSADPLVTFGGKRAAIFIFNTVRDACPAAGSTVTGVQVKVYADPVTWSSGDKLQLFKSSNWGSQTESSVTWNTRPTKGTLLAEVATTDANPRYYTFTLPAGELAYLNCNAGMSGGNTHFWLSASAPRTTNVEARCIPSQTCPAGKHPEQIVVTSQPSCTGPNAFLEPCQGKRWRGIWPNQDPGTAPNDLAGDLQEYEGTILAEQFGVLRVFRTPGSSMWGAAGGEVEDAYLNVDGFEPPRGTYRYVYLGFRPNDDWSAYDGAGTDDQTTLNLIRAGAQRTIQLYQQKGRKLWLNLVNHEPERYVYQCGGNSDTHPGRTIASYLGAWRTAWSILEQEFQAAGYLSDDQYPVVPALNVQNLNQSTPTTCPESNFSALQWRLVPRDAQGNLIPRTMGWNPYSHGGSTGTLADKIDEGYNRWEANAPADVKAVYWHFGEFGYLTPDPTDAEQMEDFNGVAARLNAGAWPRVSGPWCYFNGDSADNHQDVPPAVYPAFRAMMLHASMTRTGA